MLLNQFHDVLPGSSISIVYEDAEEAFNEAIASANNVWQNSLSALFGEMKITSQFSSMRIDIFSLGINGSREQFRR